VDTSVRSNAIAIPSEMPSETDRAWAAGFYDGEGCTVYIPLLVKNDGRTRQGHMRITVSQKDRRVLDRLVGVIGGRVYGPYSVSEVHRLQIYSWDGVSRALEIMWPYLDEEKRQQALSAMERGGFSLRHVLASGDG
jgi:hypothetical protein